MIDNDDDDVAAAVASAAAVMKFGNGKVFGILEYYDIGIGIGIGNMVGSSIDR